MIGLVLLWNLLALLVTALPTAVKDSAVPSSRPTHPVVLGTEMSELVKNPFSFRFHGARPSAYDKRQYDVPNLLQRTMLADMRYVCPQAGADRREFKWEAKFTRSNAHIHLYGLDNIDRFDTIHVSLADFDSFMHHSYCKVATEYPFSICFYHVRMQTYGRVNRESISMGITMTSSVSDEGPWVEEACLYIVGAPTVSNHSACGNAANFRAGRFTSAACTITSLDVYTVA